MKQAESYTIKDIKIEMDLILLQEQIPIKDLLKLGVGSILVFNASVNSSAFLASNGQIFASGNIVQVNENYGLEITELQQ